MTLRATLLALIIFPLAARAQDGCFDVSGQSGARSTHLVGLHDVVRLQPGCEYALAEGGPWAPPGALAGRDTDFADLYETLARAQAPSGEPRVVLARRTGRRDPTTQSLMLRYCAHYLLEEQLGFRVVPSSDGSSFRVERVSPAGCDAGRVELRALRSARSEQLTAASADQTLGASQSSLTLPQGDWSLYAARPGGRVGLRVGVFRAQRVFTPLSARLRSTSEAAPLFAAVWEPGAPGLLLRPTMRALSEPLLWPELRTAAEARVLWLARARGAEAPEVIDAAQLEAEPVAMRLPDALVREHMRASYGDASEVLVPSGSDWTALLRTLRLCLTPDYRAPAQTGPRAAVPEGAACAALDMLTTFAQAEAGVAPVEGRVCLLRGMQVMSAGRATHVAGTEPECIDLPALGVESPLQLRFAVAGDRVRLEGEGLCALLDGRPLEASAEGDTVLAGSGLLEVRQGGGPGCTGRQALSRLRLPVIDAEREWHPIGFYSGASEAALRCGQDESEGRCPWRAIAHDEETAFGYVRGRHDIELRLSTSPATAAAIGSDPTQRSQLEQDVPILGGVGGTLEGPRAPALVAVLSRGGSCPSRTYAELRERPPLEPDGLAVDDSFHVFLAAPEADDAPVHCLARATFRVRPSRALWSAGIAGDIIGMEFGLLGDTRMTLFVTTPVSLGASLPIVWYRVSFWRIFGVEVAGSLVGAAGFDPAALSRVGAMFSVSLEVGIPEIMPRLLSFGFAVVGAAQTHPQENPIAALFLALNMSTLIDLAGGR